MTINKKLATILLGVGISVSALNISAAPAPTTCYELRDWCVERVRAWFPENWEDTDQYKDCLDAYDQCRIDGGY